MTKIAPSTHTIALPKHRLFGVKGRTLSALEKAIKTYNDTDLDTDRLEQIESVKTAFTALDEEPSCCAPLKYKYRGLSSVGASIQSEEDRLCSVVRPFLTTTPDQSPETSAHNSAEPAPQNLVQFSLISEERFEFTIDKVDGIIPKQVLFLHADKFSRRTVEFLQADEKNEDFYYIEAQRMLGFTPLILNKSDYENRKPLIMENFEKEYHTRDRREETKIEIYRLKSTLFDFIEGYINKHPDSVRVEDHVF